MSLLVGMAKLVLSGITSTPFAMARAPKLLRVLDSLLIPSPDFQQSIISFPSALLHLLTFCLRVIELPVIATLSGKPAH